MSSPPRASSGQHAFETLTPDVVMDALASVGLYGDGRQLALSSYENRVYQLQLEDGPAVVAKFYRPGRWSEAQILEEHAFSSELMAAEIPVIGPLTLNGSTLHHFGGFAFSVSPSRGGRGPELDDPDVLEWIGRFLARIHTVGAAKPFKHRPELNLQTFGTESREWLLGHNKVPLDVQSAWAKASQHAIDLIAGYAEVAKMTLISNPSNGCAFTATAIRAIFCGRRWSRLPAAAPARILWIWTTPAAARPCKTCGCCSAATASNAPANWARWWTATSSFASSTGASWP